MALILAEPVVRAQLHADLRAFVPGLKEILNEQPELPASSADLPRSFILSGTTDFEHYARSVDQVIHFEVTLQDRWPDDGDIHGAKMTRAQQIVNAITQGPDYAGSPYTLGRLDTGEDRTTSGNEPIFRVMLAFEVRASDALTF